VPNARQYRNKEKKEIEIQLGIKSNIGADRLNPDPTGSIDLLQYQEL
jgi:hypothetical protein